MSASAGALSLRSDGTISTRRLGVLAIRLYLAPEGRRVAKHRGDGRPEEGGNRDGVGKLLSRSGQMTGQGDRGYEGDHLDAPR